MKKITGLVLVCAAVLSLAGCKKKVVNGNAVEALKARGTFVLGLDDSFPPLGFRDNDTNEITGYDIDLANKIYTIGLSKRTFDVYDRIYSIISCIAKPVGKPYK